MQGLTRPKNTGGKLWDDGLIDFFTIGTDKGTDKGGLGRPGIDKDFFPYCGREINTVPSSVGFFFFCQRKTAVVTSITGLDFDHVL